MEEREQLKRGAGLDSELTCWVESTAEELNMLGFALSAPAEVEADVVEAIRVKNDHVLVTPDRYRAVATRVIQLNREAHGMQRNRNKK